MHAGRFKLQEGIMNTRDNFFFLCIASVMLYLSPVQALTDKPSAAQMLEAVEFGRTNHAGIEKTLDALYACCGSTRDIIIRTKWCKLALIAGIKAQQGSDITGRDRDAIMQDPNLQIDITVSGPSIDFAHEYTAYALQNDKKILPDLLHADHFQTGEKLQKAGSLSAYYAIIRTYFRYDALDITKRFNLVLVKQQGMQVYEIDPVKYK